MPQFINTNISSLNAQRNLNSSQNALQTSLQRLSTGLRINSAKDDAAGLAISERFTAQIRGLNQAGRNANDSISLSQTAESDLGQVGENLQRIRELSVQSANATNSASDRLALDAEVQQLVAEIDRVAQQSSFNGVKLLDGTFRQTFQVGANNTAADKITISSLADARSSKLGVYTGFKNHAVGGTITSAAAGTLTVTLTNSNGATDPHTANNIAADAKAVSDAVNAMGIAGLNVTATNSQTNSTTNATSVASGLGTLTLNGVTMNVSVLSSGAANDVANRAAALAAINANSAATGVTATDTGSGLTLTSGDGRNIVASWTAGTATASTLGSLGIGNLTNGQWKIGTASANYQAPTGGFDGVYAISSVAFTGAGFTGGSTANTASTGTALSVLDIKTVSAAQNAIEAIDAALTSVNTARATLGAIQNRFSSVVSSLQTSSENLTASRSRIQDADFAVETAAMTKNQVLQQAGTAILAQANALPNNVLTLLRG
jgi:flagellin